VSIGTDLMHVAALGITLGIVVGDGVILGTVVEVIRFTVAVAGMGTTRICAAVAGTMDTIIAGATAGITTVHTRAAAPRGIMLGTADEHGTLHGIFVAVGSGIIWFTVAAWLPITTHTTVAEAGGTLGTVVVVSKITVAVVGTGTTRTCAAADGIGGSTTAFV